MTDSKALAKVIYNIMMKRGNRLSEQQDLVLQASLAGFFASVEELGVAEVIQNNCKNLTNEVTKCKSTY